ncbi:MAG: hydrogenase expression/formation protein HypE [Desulfobacteraceae bacterium]|nr:hydrogenase expression/formation protein HypE [Desulfobacteraceae bacterium]
MSNQRILLDHGSGGRQSSNLIAEMMLPVFDNPILAGLEDGAVFEMGGSRFAFSTDTYVVDPIFFPGGSIGDLAINGTVNDIAMCGAVPQYISAGLIIEEGFAMGDLKAVLADMGQAAQNAGVQVVTGDTKVVSRGAADKIFINTSGIGLIGPGIHISAANARPGDQILLSGSIADHGVTILSKRSGLSFDAPISSDSAPLNRMVKQMLHTCPDIHVLRDPTRGGVGTALNEIASGSGTGIRIYEDRIPVKQAVSGLCELLGLDPLYVANEGKLLAFVDSRHAEAVLWAMQADPYGTDAVIIGEVVADHPGRVVMETGIGGRRIVDMLSGEQLPRIC